MNNFPLNTMNPFDLILNKLQKRRRFVLEGITGAFFLRIFHVITPLCFMSIVDKVIPYKGIETMIVITLALFLMGIFEITLAVLSSHLFFHTALKMTTEISNIFFKKLLSLPLSFFETHQRGDLIARMGTIEKLRDFLTNSPINTILDIVFGLIFFSILYHFSPFLTFITILPLPFYLILSWVGFRIIRPFFSKRLRNYELRQSFLAEALAGIQTIKAANAESDVYNTWSENLLRSTKSYLTTQYYLNIFNFLVKNLEKITMLAVWWFGVSQVLSNEITLGQYMVFILYMEKITSPLIKLSETWKEIREMHLSIDRLNCILETPSENPMVASQNNPISFQGNIRFDDVWFRYSKENNYALRGVSLNIEAKQVVGIVGTSGSGKSTLIKLLQMFYQPTQGKILIDGQDISLLNLHDLRRNVGVVLQENFLFHRSVRDNIALMDPFLSMEKIIHAAKLSGAHDFIVNLPEGYETVIGERGCTLSGGQCQRIAIARSIVTDPKVLIMDEATSALDSESEGIIHDNMQHICKDKTVLIIAHRLSAVKWADKIVTFQNGSIVETGHHLQLIKNGGLYSKFYHYQSCK